MSNNIANNNLPEDIFSKTDNIPAPAADTIVKPIMTQEKKSFTPVGKPADVSLARPPQPQDLDKILAKNIPHDDKGVNNIFSQAESVTIKDPVASAGLGEKPLSSAAVASFKSGKNSDQAGSESAFKKIILIILAVGLVLGVAGVAYYFFLSNTSELAVQPLAEKADSEAVLGEQAVISEIDEIDTSNWNSYQSLETGVTFKYPPEYRIEKDNLTNLNSIVIDQPHLVLQTEAGDKELFIWAGSFTLESVLALPPNFEPNPFTGGVQYLLNRDEDNKLKVGLATFNNVAGVTKFDNNTISAYTDVGLLPSFIFFYRNEVDNNFEDIFKEIVRSVVLPQDADGDGLTDAEEKKYGTDINNVDTDGDSYQDGDEIKGGYNPLGEGLLGS